MKKYRGIIEKGLIKKYHNWIISIAQHPMYLLIDEDRGKPTVLERVPPWGAPTAEEYIKRVERNIDSMDNIKELYIDYDFSAVEIDMLCEKSPSTEKRMIAAHKRGQLDFVNATFSQSHLQTFGAEESWRQFEMGLEIFKKRFGKKVVIYLTQEVGLHEQLPQLLRMFGHEFIVLPQMYSNIEIIEGRFELGFRSVPELIKGDEFVEAIALDGTSMPVRLNFTPTGDGILSQGVEDTWEIANNIAKDRHSGPPHFGGIPDLVEMTQKSYDITSQLFDFMPTDKALRQRIKEAPPRAKARLYTYWSYIEGLWAEELHRVNKQAVEHALLAESMNAMQFAGSGKSDKKTAETLHDIWYNVLKYQHHDVYWNEVTHLRRKAINCFKEGIAKCNKIDQEKAEKVMDKKDTSGIAFFNTLPTERSIPLKCSQPYKGIYGEADIYKGNYYGSVKLVPGGYTGYPSVDTCREVKKKKTPQKIKTDFYSIMLSPGGLIKNIHTKKGNSLLKTSEYLGGEIKGMVEEKWENNRKARVSFFEGKNILVMERKTHLGPVPICEDYIYYKHHALMHASISFDFNATNSGVFWIDETKIKVHFPTNGSEIYHDIPFGYIKGREERTLFAPNWIKCGGLVYVNRGTTKNWVDEGVIKNQLAWGGKGKCFGNRHGLYWATGMIRAGNNFDLRLYGKQVIEYYLILDDSLTLPDIVKRVNDITMPVLAVEGQGNKSFYSLKNKEIAVTAVYEKNKKIWVRGYKLPNKKKSTYRNFEIINKLLDEI